MKLRKLLLCLLFVAAVFIYMAVVYGARREPRALFRRYVLKPVPQSVAEIRVDQPKSIRGYGYVFRFRISKADLSLILDSRSLEPITGMYVGSDGNYLGWNWGGKDQHPTDGLSFCPYGDRRYAYKPPAGFSDLGPW